MLRGMEMLGGVLVLGSVAAADMAAGKADSQVNPPVAGFHAIFTNMPGGLEIARFLQMSARFHVRVDAWERKEASEKCGEELLLQFLS